MNSRRSVFIPLVERSFASEGHLLEVYTERATAEDNYNDSKALDKDWDPVAMYLRKVGLYRMGCIAASAVRKLGLKKNKTSIYQWFKPQAWLEQQRLHAAYPERIIEGHSCELGLALLLLMGATQTNTAQYVIATGALSSQAQREHDVQVLPVSNLTQKLQLVIRLAQQGQLPQKKGGLFFTPKFCDQEESKAVEQLPEVQKLRALGIQVVPVAWLSEAVQTLKVFKARHVWFDYLIGVLLIAGLCWGGWTLWRERTLPMFYLAPDSTHLGQPFLVCAPGDYQSIDKQGLAPVVSVDSILGWRVKIGHDEGLDAWLSRWLGYSGYYVAGIGLSNASIPTIIIPKNQQGDIIRVLPGAPWEWAWELTTETGHHALILVAQRHKPIEADALLKTLLNTTPLDITAGANFLQAQFPGEVSFMFRIIADKRPCTS